MDNHFKRLLCNFTPLFRPMFLLNVNTRKVDETLFEGEINSNSHKKYNKPFMVGDETWIDFDGPVDFNVKDIRSGITNCRFKVGKTMNTKDGQIINTGLVFSHANGDLGSIIPSGIVMSGNDKKSSSYFELYRNYRSGSNNEGKLKGTFNTAFCLDHLNLPNNFIGMEVTNDFVKSDKERLTMFMARDPKINADYETFTDRFKNLKFLLGWRSEFDEYSKEYNQVFQNYRLPIFTKYGTTTVHLDNSINYGTHKNGYEINTTIGARHDLNKNFDLVGGVNYQSNNGYNYPVFAGFETKGYDVFGIKLNGSIFASHHNGYHT
jgi:hypothetical protein